LGLVASLNRPGANVTGSAILTAELAPKQLQVLRELIPNASRFGVLADPASLPTQSVLGNLPVAAQVLGLQLIIVNARTDSDLEMAFATFSQERVDAILDAAVCEVDRQTGLLSICRYARWTTRASRAIPDSEWPDRGIVQGACQVLCGAVIHHAAGHVLAGRAKVGAKPVADARSDQSTLTCRRPLRWEAIEAAACE
jgi:hypothetical protein